MTKVRFKFLTGDVNWREYGGKFISQKLHHKDEDGEFDYVIVKEFIPWEGKQYDDCEPYAQGVVYMVAPDLVPGETKLSAIRFSGFEGYDETKFDFEMWVDIIQSYGTAGPVGSFEGTPQQVLREMNKRAQDVVDNTLHYIGQEANKIGATVLDFMKGDTIPWLKSS